MSFPQSTLEVPATRGVPGHACAFRVFCDVEEQDASTRISIMETLMFMLKAFTVHLLLLVSSNRFCRLTEACSVAACCHVWTLEQAPTLHLRLLRRFLLLAMTVYFAFFRGLVLIRQNIISKYPCPGFCTVWPRRYVPCVFYHYYQGLRWCGPA